MIRDIQASCENRGRSGGLSLFWMTAVRLTAFLMVLNGVPLPFIPASAPAPLKVVKKAVEPQQAEAYQVKRVLRGSNVTFAANTEALPVDLTSQLGGVDLDLNKSFVITSIAEDSDLRTETNFLALIDDPKTLLFSRFASTVAGAVDWTVVEFLSGVTVVSGITVLAEGTTSPQTKTIVLPVDFDLTKTIPIITTKAYRSGTGTDERNVFSADLVDAGTFTQLKVKRGENAGNYNVDVAYQVIQFDADVEVQRGITTITADANTTIDAPTVNLNGANNCLTPAGAATACHSVTAANSTLFFTTDAGTATAGVEADYLISGELTDGSTLTFRRYDSTTTTTNYNSSVKWYVVEFKNKAFTQVGRLIGFETTNGSTTNEVACTATNANNCDVTVGSVALDRSFLNHTVSLEGAATDLSESMIRGQLSTATNLHLQRDGTPALAPDVSFGVVELPPVNLLYPNGGEWLKVGDAVNVSWEHANGSASATDIQDDTRELKVSVDGGSNFLSTALTCAATGESGTQVGADHADCGVTAGTLNKGCCQWTIPGAVGGTVLTGGPSVGSLTQLRLTDTTLGATCSASARSCDDANTTFNIKGQLIATNPAGSPWMIGATGETIQWQYAGKLRNNQAGGDVYANKTINLAYNTASGVGGWTSIANVCYNCNGGANCTAATSFTDCAAGSSNDGTDTSLHNGSFSWNNNSVPDLPYETIRFKVFFDYDNNGTYGGANSQDIESTTTADLAIRPSITGVKPISNAGAPAASQWPLGRCRVIQWTSTGTVSNMDLEYKIPGIVDNWTALPYNITTGKALNLTSQATPDSTHFYTGDADTSGANEGCEVTDTTNPAPAECANGNKCYDWTIPNNINLGNTRIRISRNKTANANGDPDPNVYDEVPGTAPTVEYFSLVSSIQVTQPNGGEYLRVNEVDADSKVLFTLTGAGGTTAVDIRYWSPASGTWAFVQDASGSNADNIPVSAATTTPYCPTAGNCYFDWKVPDDIGTVTKVRVEDSSNGAAVYDDSDASFYIKGKLTLTAPNASPDKIYLVGNSKKIKWTADGSVQSKHGNVTVQVDTGSGYANIPDGQLNGATNGSINPGAGEVTWTVPDTVSETAKIKIWAGTESNLITGVASEFTPFKIQKLVLAQPGTLEIGTIPFPTITWTPTGALTSPDNDLEVKYSLTGGSPFTGTIAACATLNFTAGSCSWDLVNNVIGNNEKNANVVVRVQLKNDPDKQGVQSSPFTVKSKLIITNPDNSPSLIWYSNQNPASPGITWTTNGYVANVDLIWDNDGTFDFATSPSDRVITSAFQDCTSAGSCAAGFPVGNWVIPKTVIANSNVRVKVVSTLNADIASSSQTSFSVRPSFIAVSAPAVDEEWYVGETNRVVTWTQSGAITNVHLQYKCGSDAYADLAADAANHAGHVDGSNTYTWAAGIPDKKAQDCYLQLTDVNNSGMVLVHGPFTIRPLITNIAAVPAAADAGSNPAIWRADAVGQTVNWTDTSAQISSVDIRLSAGGVGGFPGTLLATKPSTVNGVNSAADIVVPTTLTTNAMLKVVDATAAYVYGYSPTFKVLGKLAFVAFPNDNVYAGNTNTPIKWSKTGLLSGGGDYSVEIAVDYNDNGFQADSNTLVLTPSQAAASGSTGWIWEDPSPVITGIDDRVTQNAYLRIRDAESTRQASGYEAMYGPFKIAGSFSSITVTDGDHQTPPGTLIAGSAATVNWTAVGAAISAVVLDYSLDNGTTWKNIVNNAGAAADGLTVPNGSGSGNTYNWTPPATVFANNTALLRISDPDNYLLARGQSAAPFTLTSKTLVTNPEDSNGFDSWSAGTTQTLTWSSYGTFSHVKILYDAEGNFDGTNEVDLTADAYDGGATGTEYEGATTPNDGSYAWVIAASTPLGPTAKVKVVDADHSYGLSILSDAFRTKGSLAVLKPGTEAVPDYPAGTAGTEIKWQRFGSIAAVNLCYAVDGVSFPHPCTNIKSDFAMTANTMTITDWVPPQTVGAAYKVRVLDANDDTVFIDSSAFKVKGELALTAPLGNPVWTVGSTQDITWDINQGNIQNVKILGSLDGTFTDAPDTGGTVFTICASCPADNVVTFNGTNPVPRGKGKFTWLNIPDNYNVLGGSILAPAVPDDLAIRVQDAATGFSMVATTSPALSITGALSVNTPPAAGVAGAWRVGDTDKAVTWSVQGQLDPVKIELDPDGAGPAGFTEITNPAARPAASVGSWAVSGWTPGTKIADFKTDQALLRLSSRRGGDASTEVSTTSGAFAIYPAITAVTITPGGGEPGAIWRADADNQTVSWTEMSTPLNSVDIRLSTSGVGGFPGTLLATKASTASGTNSATDLTVPATLSTNAMIRVQDSDAAWAPYVQADSAAFKVLGKISITAFSSDNVLAGSTTTAIQWSKTGLVGGSDYPVEIAVDYNDSGFQNDANTVPLNGSILAGTQTWTWEDPSPSIDGIDDRVTETAYLRIRDLDAGRQEHPAVYGPFKIAGSFSSITVTDGDHQTPPGTLIAGSAATVNWTAVGAAISAVVLDYSLDNGTTWKNIVDNSVASAGGLTVPNSSGSNTYNWTPPVTAFSNGAALIRVSDPNNYTLARGQSAAPFTLTSKTVVTNPAGANDSWSTTSTQTLTWSSYGTFSHVKILYDAEGNFDGTNEVDLTADAYDGGATGTEYEGATTPNDGSYAWVITASTPLGPTAKIKVVDADHSYGLSVLSDNFETKGSLTTSSPTGAVELTAGVATSIAWQRFGNISAVHVQYSDDDGATYYSSCTSPGAAGNAIACNWTSWTGNSGSLNWAPPQTILSKLSEAVSQGYKVRVVDASNATVSGVTPKFTVEGQLAVTAPVSDPGWKIGDTALLTWDLTQGNLQNVKLVGSKSGNFTDIANPDQPGGDTFTIVASTDADNVNAFNAGNTPRGRGSYSWTIADDFSVGSILSASVPGTLKVRVLDVASCAPPAGELCFDTVADSAAFSLIGKITVTTPPAAGAPGAWRVGDTDKLVSWSANGQLGAVKIELDPDGAGPANFVEITDPANRPEASVGNWAVSGWTPGTKIPDFKTDAAILRITRVGGGAGTQVSGSSTAFAIYPAITAVTITPGGGEPAGVWRAGATTQTVSWTDTSANLGAVDLLLDTGTGLTLLVNGNGVVSTVNGVNAATTLTVPNAISTSAVVRVQDDDAAWAPYVQADSASFKILGKITITPFLNDNVVAKSTTTAIQWSKTGLVGGSDYPVEIAVDYNDSGFQNDANTVPLNGSILAGTQTWTWEDPSPSIDGIDDRVTETAYLRIRDLDAGRQEHPAVYGPFKIAGSFSSITVTDGDHQTPPGTLIAGSAATVNWTAVGAAISAVVLDYSLDNGTTWKNIVNNAGAAADGLTVPNGSGSGNTYNWTPPATVFANNTALLRISDPDNYLLARGQSAAPFTLTSKTLVTNPEDSNGFDSWSAGTTQTLTWSSYGTFSHVKILYDAEGNFDGVDEVDLTNDLYDGGVGGPGNEYVGATTANDGSYAWVIAASTPLGPSAKIKIVDADHSFGLSVLSDNFRLKGGLAVMQPNGSAELVAGVAGTIQWQRFGNLTGVHVYYSDDDGATYYTSCVSPGAPGNAIACNRDFSAGDTDSLNWQPPQTILSKYGTLANSGYKVKVVDKNDITVEGVGPEFSVEGQLAVTAPVTNPVWTIGSSQTISWDLTQGNIQNVKLVGSKSGTFDMSLAADAPGADTFTIAGSTDADNVTPFNGTATPRGRGSYSWTIADTFSVGSILSPSIPGTLKVRVLDVASCAPNNPPSNLCFDTLAESPAFSLIGSITVTTPPTIGQPGAWRVGDTDKFVSWSANGQLGAVKIELDPDGAGPAGWTEVTDPANRPSASAGNWSVANWTPGTKIGDFKTTNAVLRVTRIGGGAGTQVSGTSGPFAIYPKITSVTVIPAGQDAGSNPVIWRAGMQSPAIEVRWTDTSTNLSSVDIYLSTTGIGGLPGTLLETGFDSTVNGVNSSANSPAKLITVPNAIVNNQAVIRVRDSDPTFKDYVAADSSLFGIFGNITFSFSSPLAGATWLVDDTNRLIAWNAAGPMGSLNIYVDYGLGNGWELLTTQDSSVVSSWAWNPIPNQVSTNVRIRITDADQEATTSFVSGVFTISPWFNVTAPALNERVPANPQLLPPSFAPYTITWDRHGLNPYVRLYYSLDGFSGPGILIDEGANPEGPDGPDADSLPDNDGVVDNDGSFDWRVPDLAQIGSGPVSAMVRVAYSAQAVNAETAYDNSDPFKIVAGFAVLSPSSTSRWPVTTSKNIQWVCSSTFVPTVRVEYSKNDGSNYIVPAIDSGADNVGAAGATRTLPWTVPDAITFPSFLKVKVTAVNDANASAASSSGAKITANFRNLQVIEPPSTPTTDLKVAQTYNITWDFDGSGSTVSDVRLEYSKDNFATPGQSITFPSTGNVTTVNDRQFEWPIPDDISSGVSIRLQSSSDVDALVVSSPAYKLHGHFSTQKPDGTQAYTIYDAAQNPVTHEIKWQTTGNVARVRLLAYTTDSNDLYFRDGSNNVHTLANPYVIQNSVVNNPNGVTTFNWQVPDKASPNVRVRVQQADDPATSGFNEADPLVFADTPVFQIRGSIAITAPTGGENLNIGSTKTITWNRTGSSIAHVKISYSTTSNSGPWTPIDEGATLEGPGGANDGVVVNDGAYNWVVPADPDPTVWMKIEDVNDPGVVQFSAGSFRIQRAFVFSSPSGGERWVTNENRAVGWTMVGPPTTVDLAYSINDWLTSNPIASGVQSTEAGPNSFGWIIPNDLSTNVKVRLTDTSDPAVTLAAGPLTIDYYHVKFIVLDLLTNLPIAALSVNATENVAPQNPWDTWVQSGISSGLIKDLPAGSWTATWTQQNYGDQGVNFVLVKDMNDPDPSDDPELSDNPLVIYMETKVVHIWEAVTEISYSPATDTASIASTLRRDGSTVTGAVSSHVKIYDAGTLIKDFRANGAPDAQGFYNFTWSAPTGLVSGKVYNVVTTIVNAAGGVFNTPRTLTITAEKKLQDVQDTVNQKLDTPLSQVKNDIFGLVTTKLDTQTGIIQTKLDTQTGIIQGKMDEFSGKVASSIISLEDAAGRSQVATEKLEHAADDSLKAAKQLEVVGKKYSARLLLPTTVLMGQKVVVRYRAEPNLTPLLDLFTSDHDEALHVILKADPMVESTTQPGLYEREMTVSAENGFIASTPFTVFVQSQETGNLEAGSVFVESTSLSSIEGLVAADSGAKRLAQETLDSIKAIQGVLSYDGDIGQALQNLKGKLERLPKAIADEGNPMQLQMKSTISQVAEQIKTLAGDEGYDFSQLVKKGLEESPTISQIRESTDEVQGATEVMQVLMERKLGGVDDPVIAVTFQ